jgi:23S rRNA (cytosine1962-C5)-methyltransferase
MIRPLVRLAPRQGRRLRAGAPWAFSNEIAMTPEARRLKPGSLVRLEGDDGVRFGVAMFNPHSLIAARVLDRDPEAEIGDAWVRARLAQALALRERFFARPFYRLVHADADRLPGLVVDRYGDVLVVQANTAGMDRLMPDVLVALQAEFAPTAVIARNDSGARRLDGLEEKIEKLQGEVSELEVEEAGARFPVDPLAGQKTGWFFDQRFNRDRVAGLAAHGTVLDVFCHSGGFGVRCAAAGAKRVMLVDSSEAALAQAQRAAALNGVAATVETRNADAFEAMGALAGGREQFDIVICDPPAFARSRKDAEAGLRAYARMARLAASLVTPGGFLFVASCSHHAPLEPWSARIAEGLHRARREARIVATTGAGPDHPVHPQLPETAYLKAQLMQLL